MHGQLQKNMNEATIEKMYSILCAKVKLQDIDVHNRIIYSTGPLHKAHHSQTRVKFVQYLRVEMSHIVVDNCILFRGT